MKPTNKGVQFALPKEVAERLAFLRKFKHRIDDLPAKLASAIELVIAEQEKTLKISPDTWKTSCPCPKCSHGTLLKRSSTKRPDAKPFLGCSRYPDCNYVQTIK